MLESMLNAFMEKVKQSLPEFEKELEEKVDFAAFEKQVQDIQ